MKKNKINNKSIDIQIFFNSFNKFEIKIIIILDYKRRANSLNLLTYKTYYKLSETCHVLFLVFHLSTFPGK